MTPSQEIDKQILELSDWRGRLMTRIRALIHEADPDIVEEWKWGTGVYTHTVMICAVGAFKDHIKINFFRGASLPDPEGLFNGGLEAKLSRSIDLLETDPFHEAGFQALIRTSVALLSSK